MNNTDLKKVIEKECEKWWNKNMVAYHGSWDIQADDTKAEYYNDMYELYTNSKNSAEEIIKPIKTIETEVWEKDSETSSLLTQVGYKTYEEIYKELVDILKEQNLWEDLDYFHLRDLHFKKDEEFPSWRFIKCYAVIGGSEGHYIHVDVVPTTGDTICIFLGKTFLGMDHALKVSNTLTKAFYGN